MRGAYAPLVGFLLIGLAIIVGTFYTSMEQDRLTRMVYLLKGETSLTYTEILLTDVQTRMHTYIRTKIYDYLKDYEPDVLESWIKNNIKTWINDYADALDKWENLDVEYEYRGEPNIERVDDGLRIEPNVVFHITYREKDLESLISVEIPPFLVFIPFKEWENEKRSLKEKLEGQFSKEGVKDNWSEVEKEEFECIKTVDGKEVRETISYIKKACKYIKWIPPGLRSEVEVKVCEEIDPEFECEIENENGKKVLKIKITIGEIKNILKEISLEESHEDQEEDTSTIPLEPSQPPHQNGSQ